MAGSWRTRPDANEAPREPQGGRDRSEESPGEVDRALPPEQRASEVMQDTQGARLAGSRINARIGARGFGRSGGIGCSPRLFERYDLADPWNPDTEDLPLRLGPAAQKLTERRQPAPHARVKEDTPKPKPQPAPPPQPLSQAPKYSAVSSKPAPPPPRPGAAMVPRRSPRPAPEPPEPPMSRQVTPRGEAPRASAGRFRLKSSAPTTRTTLSQSFNEPEVLMIEPVRNEPPAPEVSPPTPAEPSAPKDKPSAPKDKPNQPRPNLRNGPDLMNLDNLFAAATLQGRDKRVGQESEEPKSRKPKVVDRSESPAEKKKRATPKRSS